jgi:acyl-CoA synthetase (AMP-forming)/AMP-acid ligase II
LAEATLLVSGVKPGSGVRVSALASGVVSCGRVPPEHNVAVLDPSSLQVLPEGQIGEICVSGPSLAQGYWRNPSATASGFVLQAGRRYLRTGDLGFVHDHEIYISGRLKDLIIVRGRNVVPQDIEDFLAGHVSPLQLGRVSVFSLQTDTGEAIGVAAELSRAAARSMRPEQLCQAIAAAVHECVDEPARLVLLLGPGALPRTSSGKLQRSACAQRFRSGELAPLAVYRDGVLQVSQPSAAAAVEVV